MEKMNDKAIYDETAKKLFNAGDKEKAMMDKMLDADASRAAKLDTAHDGVIESAAEVGDMKPHKMKTESEAYQEAWAEK